MRILAFETSCDDTSVALFDGPRLVAMETRSQVEHAVTGGVVPEIAARLHANVIFDALQNIFDCAGWKLEDIDLFACTEKPGLIPSLLVGKIVAKTLARLRGKPLQWIDHIQAHMYALWLERETSVVLPAVCLTASGGHNEIYWMPKIHTFERVGATRDDSAGEAFDKVSMMLGLGYPGGPVIEREAALWKQPLRQIFPLPLMEKGNLDFSFSGLKSAVRREIESRGGREALTAENRCEICAEFQWAVTETLCRKLFWAADKFGTPRVMLAGGVSANTLYRQRVAQEAEATGRTALWPTQIKFTGDNAAMVGIAAWLLATQ